MKLALNWAANITLIVIYLFESKKDSWRMKRNFEILKIKKFLFGNSIFKKKRKNNEIRMFDNIFVFLKFSYNQENIISFPTFISNDFSCF